ncbi:hypothetical protein B0H11DRAFT_2269997 [Mycena galericulata]|nr:hypothetical protein B0H11DRAFT_2269997 [Mycena galericulata]
MRIDPALSNTTLCVLLIRSFISAVAYDDPSRDVKMSSPPRVDLHYSVDLCAHTHELGAAVSDVGGGPASSLGLGITSFTFVFAFATQDSVNIGRAIHGSTHLSASLDSWTYFTWDDPSRVQGEDIRSPRLDESKNASRIARMPASTITERNEFALRPRVVLTASIIRPRPRWRRKEEGRRLVPAHWPSARSLSSTGAFRDADPDFDGPFFVGACAGVWVYRRRGVFASSRLLALVGSLAPASAPSLAHGRDSTSGPLLSSTSADFVVVTSAESTEKLLALWCVPRTALFVDADFSLSVACSTASPTHCADRNECPVCIHRALPLPLPLSSLPSVHTSSSLLVQVGSLPSAPPHTIPTVTAVALSRPSSPPHGYSPILPSCLAFRWHDPAPSPSSAPHHRLASALASLLRPSSLLLVHYTLLRGFGFRLPRGATIPRMCVWAWLRSG